jgi:hypothetical protein
LIRPFAPRDVFLVKSLQRKCLMLGLERELISGRTPLAEALAQQLPLGRKRSFTYILRDSAEGEALAGLAQLFARPQTSDGEIICLAPRLEETQQGLTVWQSLLEHLVVVAGQNGLLRLYAKLPETASESIDLLQRTGFTIYTLEDVFKWDGQWKEPSEDTRIFLLPQEPHDTWTLKRLYALTTPRPVQQAEGRTNWDFQSAEARRFILESEGEVAGALYLREGQRGSWMRVLLSPEKGKNEEELLRGVMEQLSGQCRLPLYFGVRHHQGGMARALERYGYLPFARQCLLVRQVAVSVKQTMPVATPALEKRAEVAPSASTSGRIGSTLI